MLPHAAEAHFIGWLTLLLLIASIGCRALAPLPPANFQEPGWKVQSGQAVWRLGRGKSDIAGEALYATNPAKQRTLVQFSKPPFMLVIAQTSPNHWVVEFPPENRLGGNWQRELAMNDVAQHFDPEPRKKGPCTYDQDQLEPQKPPRPRYDREPRRRGEPYPSRSWERITAVYGPIRTRPLNLRLSAGLAVTIVSRSSPPVKAES